MVLSWNFFFSWKKFWLMKIVFRSRKKHFFVKIIFFFVTHMEKHVLVFSVSLCNTHFDHRKLRKNLYVWSRKKKSFFFHVSSRVKIKSAHRKKNILHEFSFFREIFLCKEATLTCALVVLQTFKNWLKTRRMKTQWHTNLWTVNFWPQQTSQLDETK